MPGVESARPMHQLLINEAEETLAFRRLGAVPGESLVSKEVPGTARGTTRGGIAQCHHVQRERLSWGIITDTGAPGSSPRHIA